MGKINIPCLIEFIGILHFKIVEVSLVTGIVELPLTTRIVELPLITGIVELPVITGIVKLWKFIVLFPCSSR